MGEGFDITEYVDADHAGDQLTCRSHTGIIISVNSTPIIWHYKHQFTIKSSTFGSKVVALRTYLEIVKGLCYKLRMMSVPINGTAYMFGYNTIVFNNASIP